MSEKDFEAKAAAVSSGAGGNAASRGGAAQDAASSKPGAAPAPRTYTRRSVLAMAGCGVAGLVVGGALASWGVTEKAISSGRIEMSVLPTKLIVTDRARCSGCQRCEMMCTLRNDGIARQSTARVRVGENYFYGHSVGTGDGVFGNCQFTIKTCKQCRDAACAAYCPVHAIHPDPETGARVVDEDVCIGCGMCSAACPWNMPVVNDATGKSSKCIACGRCAQQCPNGAITFIDWEDIAQACIDKGLVSSAYATANVPA